MITKIKYIKDLAVFKDFSWDKSFAQDRNSLLLKPINIIYGRNYSGKTTLSRIFRALEIGTISDKYKNPQFSVEFDDGLTINENNLSENKAIIRVFNEDFVKDNLSFLFNSEGDIRSFAVIGENNNKLEKEIAEIQTELGTNKDGEEKTGLYKEQEQKKVDYNKSKDDHQSAVTKLENQLSQKATGDKTIAIKYKPEIYGDLNYNVAKLKADIGQVLDNSYTPLSNDEKDAKLNLLRETAKDNIPEMPTIEGAFSSFIVQTKNLLVKQIGKSEKIEELVKDTILNKWAKEGKRIHEQKNLEACAFCGSPITQSRWDKLEKHFDEESTNFEKEIESLIDRINDDYETIKQELVINKQNFYSKFEPQIDELIEKINQTKKTADETSKSLISQLKSKQNNLFDVIPFVDVVDFSKDIVSITDIYEKLRNESNSYTTQLTNEQDKAKVALRLREVYDFVTTIKYSDVISDIDNKKKDCDNKNTILTGLSTKIKENEQLIEAKKSLMNDEEKGATKVNEYLTDFFGHKYLSLKAIKKSGTDNHLKFEVFRDNEKAYHLSEGECSLIAFCYFVAKLEDIVTKDKKPIIWIDDPISSLDSNHIFFVYSLINGEIVQNSMYNQLFISTHNLDFLKYLKRLPGAYNDDKKNEEKKNFRFYIINRTDSTSTIELMPQYMKKYVTEFNYLFKQIYLCSTITKITDKNYTIFYNFGNNARKFLEIFLYYRYPDDTKDEDKLINFFGDNIISEILTNRLNNEYSHLCATFERGATITEVPEMNKVAKLIIKIIKQKDKEQYNALVRSIGMENEQ